MTEPEVLPKQGNRLLKLLPQGKQAVLLLARLVPMLREVAPLLEGLLGGVMGSQAGGRSVQEVEDRLRTHLQQSASAMDQQSEEIRFRLKEQTAATARLEADIHAIRELLARESADRAALRVHVERLDKAIKTVTAGVALCAVLLIIALVLLVRLHG